jgi:hypothetical protein
MLQMLLLNVAEFLSMLHLMLGQDFLLQCFDMTATVF